LQRRIKNGLAVKGITGIGMVFGQNGSALLEGENLLADKLTSLAGLHTKIFRSLYQMKYLLYTSKYII